MTTFDWTKLNLPKDARDTLNKAPRVIWPLAADELIDLACGGPGLDQFEVRYDVPEKGSILEATVARVRNGVVANYPEPYMRRRDPDCMVIADDLPTDKPTFKDRFGYEFKTLRDETLSWLSQQPLVAFAFAAGRKGLGIDGLMIAPANAAFFAFALAQLQGFQTPEELDEGFEAKAIIYVAPPFRHTRFDGRQMVVHNRREELHEMFAYNLYPGPSAKKGVYGVLINIGEKERWITAHCSVVQVITPYDNVVTLMHEGACGGGKSEMLEQVHRESDGRLLLGRNIITNERRHLEISRTCDLYPVTDDMALCHPSIQDAPKYLKVMDAENAWFVRVNHIRDYGTDPHLEKLTAQPPESLVFMNIDAVPKSRALIWEHIEDSPGKPCPNPRVIVPRKAVPNVVNEPVQVDIRSFGVRTPPCTREKPTYGIIGLFHILPPSLGMALAAGRAAGLCQSEHRGQGRDEQRRRRQLLAVRHRPARRPGEPAARAVRGHAARSRYILTPNQHVGAWETGFMPAVDRPRIPRPPRERQVQAGSAPAGGCPLLGSALFQLQVEGRMVPRWFLQVNTQPEVGDEAYDKGAQQLYDFFTEQLGKFNKDDLAPLGRQIIQCCLDRGNVEQYEALLPQQ